MAKRNKAGLTEAEFLQNYNPEKYDRPSVTVDILLLRMRKDFSCLQTLLVKRDDHPYMNCWSLPGGFVGAAESAYSAAGRVLKNKTGISDIYLEQIYTMTQPDRDPRMRVIGIFYTGLIPFGTRIELLHEPQRPAEWFNIEFRTAEEGDKKLVLTGADTGTVIEYSLVDREFNNGHLTVTSYVPVLNGAEMLAFDHAEIITEGLTRLKNKVIYTDIAFNLVPDEFTLPDLQQVYEVISGTKMYKKNFRDKVADRVEATGEKAKPVISGKSSSTYKYKNVNSEDKT